MAPSVRAKVGISPSVPALTLHPGGVDHSPPIKSSHEVHEGRPAGRPSLSRQPLILSHVPRSAIPYLVLLPLTAVFLVGAGLVSNHSWLFSIGFGLLLAGIALLITLRRQGPR